MSIHQQYMSIVHNNNNYHEEIQNLTTLAKVEIIKTINELMTTKQNNLPKYFLIKCSTNEPNNIRKYYSILDILNKDELFAGIRFLIENSDNQLYIKVIMY